LTEISSKLRLLEYLRGSPVYIFRKAPSTHKRREDKNLGKWYIYFIIYDSRYTHNSYKINISPLFISLYSSGEFILWLVSCRSTTTLQLLLSMFIVFRLTVAIHISW
jgi:hypothetical protein